MIFYRLESAPPAGWKAAVRFRTGSWRPIRRRDEQQRLTAFLTSLRAAVLIALTRMDLLIC